MLKNKLLILLATLIISDLTGFKNLSGLAHAGLNDTGITTCSNATQNGLPCPVAGFPGQDAEYGTNSFNFTKLDANGNAMPVTATNHVCVQDNVTGLMWEIKTDDGGLRDKDNTYTWYDSNSTDGNLGTSSGGNCATSGRCDTEKFVADVNATNLCGHNDWRVPDPYELASIVDYSVYHPTIDITYFPNSINNLFWTKSPIVFYSSLSWIVNFIYGEVYGYNRYRGNVIRLVRGDQWLLSFVNNNDGTVTNQNTGLMWAKCSQGQNATDCSGSASYMTWQQALQVADTSTLAGYNDWQLPNAKELQSLANYSVRNPAISSSYFPNTDVANYYWTGSPVASHSSNSWYVQFSYGSVLGSNRYDNYAVRLVRNGQSLASFPLNVTKTGPGTGIVTSTPTGINCGTTCNANFTSGTAITLTATPAAGSQFAGWSGDPDCSDGSVTMNANKSCTATFNLAVAAPTVTTLAATNIDTGSATLNGSVVSTGAAATVSFDFGTTTAYGTNLVANPAQVYSSTAVAVSANKTALTCNTLYHYRVKATNSADTGYGADKTFTTATCPVVTINSWLFPTNPIVLPTQAFTLAVTAKSNSQQIGSYRYEVTFDVTKLAIDYTQCPATNGVCAGSDAPAFFTANINYGTNPATITLNGLGAIGPGNDLQLLTIHFKSQNTFSITPVTLKTLFLDNAAGNSIGLGAAGASVNIVNGICGDADGNTRVNIVDALAIARKVVGMPPPPTVDATLADVNQNGALSIVDALHIARYSIGLVIPPEVCKIGVAL